MLIAQFLWKRSSGIFSRQGWNFEIESYDKTKPKTYAIALLGPESPIIHLVVVFIFFNIAVALLVATAWQLRMLRGR
jgi:hypothetical protein